VSCHDPHGANYGALVTDPSTRESWTGTNEGFCLTCHGGTVPAGVAFPRTSSGTGYDKSQFVGTTHDTQMGGNSCGHCHLSHSSWQPALLTDTYVMTDRNPYGIGDGSYALCWGCHVESTIVQTSNAFGGRHRLHVISEGAPCILCHDVHRGFDAGEKGLIDFDASVRRGYNIAFIGGKDGSTSFSVNAGQTQGNCYIQCHGEDHTPKSYTRTVLAKTTGCTPCH
jgi:predicted CXXCH cytochrome family protein